MQKGNKNRMCRTFSESYFTSGHATALAGKYFLLTLSRCIQPRLTIYVCQQQARHQPPIKPGGGDGGCTPRIFVTCAQTPD